MVLIFNRLFKNDNNNKIVIPVMNKLTITTNYLKNIYIYIVCVYFSFLSFQIISQENILELDCVQTEYFYSSGELSSKGCLINGNPNGEWKSYYKSGIIKSEGFWNNNKLSGKWSFYNIDSVLQREIEYESDLKNGKEIIFFENGNKESVTNWILGNKELSQIIYFESGFGSIKYNIQYESDLKNGKTIEYAQDGRIITYKIYKKGLITSIEKFNRFDKNSNKTGIWKYFYENNRVSEEGPYRNNLRHGIFRFYDKNGNLDKIVRYEFGNEVIDNKLLNKSEIINQYDDDGSLMIETVYKNGLKNGVSRVYNKNGEIIGGSIYSEGIKISEGITDASGLKQGPWEYPINDGLIKSKGRYENGFKVDEWLYFNSDNGFYLEQKGNYKKGELDGVWKWYDKTGFIIRLETWDNGLEDGEFIEYDSYKNLILKGFYKNGLRVGEWFYHVNDHKELGDYLNGERDGIWVYNYSDKQKMFEGVYSFGQKEGIHKEWYSSGILKSNGKYEGGVKNGKWRYYMEDGLLKHTYIYRYGKLWKVDGRRVARKRDSLRN